MLSRALPIVGEVKGGATVKQETSVRSIASWGDQITFLNLTAVAQRHLAEGQLSVYIEV